jgi:Na+-translocating ferredoxin:NAD+ oxidoreductase RnfD subunit
MTQPAPALTTTDSAPFIHWPVSRREFYRVVAMALLLAITWGVLIYGVRVIIMLGSSLIAATVMHVFLQRVLQWDRARALLASHTVMSVLLLVALARPTWPAWIVAVGAFLFPVIFCLIGGAGRERVPVALVTALLIQYAFLPMLQGHTYTGKPDAVLARDRLLMGDIRDQHEVVPGRGSDAQWPTSLQLAGNDAVASPMPAAAAARGFDEISAVLRATHEGPSRRMSAQDAADIDHVLERLLAYDLPGMDLFMLGVTANRVGAASLIAITIAGLILAYRYILRPRSVTLFLGAYILATISFAFTPGTVQRVGFAMIWDVFQNFPAECITLLEFLVLSSDAGFAAIFLLALPRAEPLTARGRRVYLVLAGLLAAGLHRLDPTAPAASLLLCLMMPLAPLFDRLMGGRSWLNTKATR